MNKSELIEAVASKADVSKAAAGRVLDALLETVTTTVAQGDDVVLIGFGAFKASQRAARSGRNPQTGATVTIPEATVPKFTPGAAFKAAVAKR